MRKRTFFMLILFCALIVACSQSEDEANQLPTITGTPSATATEDVEYSDLSIFADDADGDSLIFSISNNPSWLSIDATSGNLSGTPLNADVGIHADIMATVSDGRGGTASITFTITVSNSNDAPSVVLSSAPSYELVDSDFPYNIDMSSWFTDVDAADSLTLSISNNTDSTSISTAVSGTSLTLSRGAGNSAKIDITVQATDLSSASASTSFSVILAPILYGNGTNWNDYVSNDGSDVYHASDTACNPASDGPAMDACIHAGEIRYFNTGLTTACANLVANDSLSALVWVCDDSGTTTVFYSSGLADGKYLSDLIDFTTDTWKDIQLTVTESAATVYTSKAGMKWWTNPIVVDNDGMTASTAVAGTIYLVKSNPAAAYTLDAEKTALVVQSGVTAVSTIYANNQNFLWLEGTIDATGNFAAIDFSSTKFSVARNVTLSNGTGFGVNLSAAQMNHLEDITSTGFGQYHISFSSSASYNRVINLSASNSTSMGISISNNSSNNVLQTISIDGSGSSAISLSTASNNTLSNLTLTGNAGGLNLSGSSNNVISGVTVSGDATAAIYLGSSSSNNDISQISANGNYSGVSVGATSNGNRFSDMIIANNDTAGLDFNNSSNNTVFNVKSYNNGYSGVGLENGASNNQIYNIFAMNNRYYGVGVGENCKNNRLFNIVAANNDYDGVNILGGQNNLLMNITAANNNYYGVSFTYSGFYSLSPSDNSLLNVAIINNQYGGLSLSSARNNTLINIASANNQSNNVYLEKATSDPTVGSTGNYFSGTIKVGNATSSDCYVQAESTNGALADDAGSVDGTHSGTCVEVSPSDFGTATTAISLAASFIGKVETDDSSNGSDNNGTDSLGPGLAVYDNITDFSNFENDFRGWGLDGSVFPNTDQRGPCLTSNNCRIWDWRLSANDTGDAGSAAILAVLTQPNANSTYEHAWQGTAADQAACTSAFPDSIFVATNDCRTTALRNAVEIIGDNDGNDNGLCESEETCLFTPNIAGYQGHGTTDAATTVTGGVLSNISLVTYSNNGI
ncbi:MAG: right-handed parallel beta-helix repeat-containing protein [Gammaproteobacteria bacterium]|nr:right-handed parallel beta-helix repeat-containing protein [Gammaproteobacteria bacterium]